MQSAAASRPATSPQRLTSKVKRVRAGAFERAFAVRGPMRVQLAPRVVRRCHRVLPARSRAGSRRTDRSGFPCGWPLRPARAGRPDRGATRRQSLSLPNMVSILARQCVARRCHERAVAVLRGLPALPSARDAGAYPLVLQRFSEPVGAADVIARKPVQPCVPAPRCARSGAHARPSGTGCRAIAFRQVASVMTVFFSPCSADSPAIICAKHPCRSSVSNGCRGPCVDHMRSEHRGTASHCD